MKTPKIIKELDNASIEVTSMKQTEFFLIQKRAITKVYQIYKMKYKMVQIPLELSRIYVINLKERESKMPVLQLKEEGVLQNIILNPKTGVDLLLRMLEVEQEGMENRRTFLNSILKLLI